ncbi:MAG: PQQ-dependent sugar dehydrogenase [Alphaproteobacteria bacterium]|nr:PQQ-dependent sugar dehydrogenase [Alphaproteobacteria bacterium]
MECRNIHRIRLALTLFLSGAALASPASASVYESGGHRFEAVVVTGDLDRPWGLAFLPDGRMLVTEREGALRMITPGGGVTGPLAGVPEVFARGQGGLLDVVLHPDFAENSLVYLTYSRPGDDGATTALVRARLEGAALADVETIFVADNPASGGRHFGSRMAFGPDGKLYVSIGERGEDDEAQNLSNHNGTVVRLNDDGTVPDDNPFVGRAGVPASTFSYGHRNPQGMTVHPTRGEVWVHEHGPRGGDEINLLKPGANYGWPVVTFGESYAGFPIGEGTSKPGMEPPLHHWTPSIAPSGMAFYTGDAFPQWRGDLLVGSLKFQYLARLDMDGTRVLSEDRLLEDVFGRVRDVRQGPDGLIYLLTDESDGSLVRLQPAG